MLRLVAGRIVEASRVIWRRGVILWEPLLPDERSFTSSSSRVDDVVFSGKVADGVKEVPTTSLQRVVLLGIRVLCCGLFGQKNGRWWVSRKRCQLIDYNIPSFYFRYEFNTNYETGPNRHPVTLHTCIVVYVDKGH